MPANEPITRLLAATEQGDHAARDELFHVVYDDLRRMADGRLRGLPPGATLQPTALVNEAYIRLFALEDIHWANRRHFFFAAARAMQHIVVEYARRHAAVKRGGRRDRVPLDADQLCLERHAGDILEIESILTEFQRAYPETAEVVRLRFFAGLTHERLAEVLGISVAKARREWEFAKSWMLSRLTDA